MIIGDPSTFAIESRITCAYERLSFRALGFFVIHIGGRCFGVSAPEASMLACSLGGVEDRLARPGLHTASFVSEGAGDRVRLIGFGCSDGFRHDPETLADQWLDASAYYAILDQWRRSFLAEWEAAEKVQEENQEA